MQINISTRSIIILIVTITLFIGIVASMLLLIDSRKKTAISIAKQNHYHDLAGQLRQTSNDLTRMARSYIITGNELFKHDYYKILDIRDGKAPRPKHLGMSYWDFVIANEEDIPSQGQAISLLTLMKNAGITDNELDILTKAKKHSDDLTAIEKTAFAAMKGLFPDASGAFTIKRNPDPKYAQEILYNAKYHKAKADIMRLIETFEDVLNNRIRLDVATNLSHEKLYWRITIFFLFMAAFFCIWVFLHFRRTILKPIVKLSQVTQGIISGELNDRAPVELTDEIGTLNTAFNDMIEARIKIEFELKKNEQGLRTTLNSIGDAMIATDIYGNIVRMNPVAEKLCGYKFEKAEGKPLDEIFQIINTTTREPVSTPVDNVLRKNQPIGLADHTILVAQDGKEHQIADSAAPIRDDDGDITGVVLVFRDVSEEYAIQKSLHESEERYKRLFENAEVAIFNEDLFEIKIGIEKLRDSGVTDIHSYLKNNGDIVMDFISKVKILHVNNATLKLFGATNNIDFIHDFDNTFGPNAYDVFLNGLCAIWNKDKLYRAMADFKTLDGTLINAIISYPIPETMEGFKNIPISIIDITELKNTETAYRESEERLSLHLEHSPLGVISWDKNFNCVQWNPAAEQIFGFSQEEAMGKKAVDFISHESFKGEIDEISMVLKQKNKGSHTINKNITKDGQSIICEWFNTPLIDNNGNFIGAASMVQDITKHKTNEDELRKLSQAVEQSPSSIIITDANGTIEYVNPQFEISSGYSSSEVIGKNARFARPPQTAEEEYHHLWDVIRSGKEWRGRLHSTRKDGSLYWESASISPITGEDGEITHYMASKMDITKRKQMEDQLQRSHKMEAVGELAGGIAHDFNNLLGIIIGNLDLMKRRVEGNEKLQSQLEKAQKAALRGSALTRRLLSFSHQSPEISSPVNINKIILSLEELIGKSLTQKVILETNLADNLWSVNLNTGDFEDMLINLSLNARDAMQGKGKLIIETKNAVLNQPINPDDEIFSAGEYIEIIVSDTGMGMSKETAAKVFDPFFTTKTKDKGTGLGLSMVYGFIQRAKGHISVNSEQGVGTTFKIYLPRSINEPEPIKIPKKTIPTLPRGHETILIVDDEQELVTIAKYMLDELGYKTICCHSADEALNILKKNKEINLLFSDVVMPGPLNGFDLADNAIQIYPKLKILLTTGFTDKMQDPKITQKWGEKIIAKPYRKSELVNRIRIILDTPNK